MTIALIALIVAIGGLAVIAIMFGVAWVIFAEIASRKTEDDQ